MITKPFGFCSQVEIEMAAANSGFVPCNQTHLPPRPGVPVDPTWPIGEDSNHHDTAKRPPYRYPVLR